MSPQAQLSHAKTCSRGHFLSSPYLNAVPRTPRAFWISFFALEHGLGMHQGDWWQYDALLPRPRSRRVAAHGSFLRTSFDDALTIDSAVLPLDKMVAIKDACKLTLADPNDAAGPSKIFQDNLKSGASCAEKVGSNLLAASLGEGTGTRFKGNLEVELGSQDREDLQAVQDTCHDFASLLLRRLGRKDNAAVGRADATRVLKAFGRCLQSMGEGTTLMGCEMGGDGGEDDALCKVEEGAEENASSWF